MDAEKALAELRLQIFRKPALFNRVEYNPADEPTIRNLIDAKIKQEIQLRYFGKWPSSGRESLIAESINRNVWRVILDDERGRQAIEQRMVEYWENPSVTVNSDQNSVSMDLGIVPGPIVLASNGAYTIAKSEFVEDMELKPIELVRRLTSLRDRFPKALRYEVEVITTPHLRDHSVLHYRYDSSRDVLQIHQHETIFESKEPVGGDLQRLVDGRSSAHSRHMKVLRGGRVGPPQ